jgi:hypothetical protein
LDSRFADPILGDHDLVERKPSDASAQGLSHGFLGCKASRQRLGVARTLIEFLLSEAFAQEVLAAVAQAHTKLVQIHEVNPASD